MVSHMGVPQIAFKPKSSKFEARVRESFGKQTVMKTLGIILNKVDPGIVELEMPYQQALSQQHGFIHAGVTTTALDSACAYSAFSLMPDDAAVLTVELKTSLLAPAKGEHFRFEGAVVKPGRSISFCEGRAYAVSGGQIKLVASMSATIMALQERPGLAL